MVILSFLNVNFTQYCSVAVFIMLILHLQNMLSVLGFCIVLLFLPEGLNSFVLVNNWQPEF
jgi:hypothetical protein